MVVGGALELVEHVVNRVGVDVEMPVDVVDRGLVTDAEGTGEVDVGLDIPITATMTAACVVGALAGATLAGRVPQRQLGRGFAALVAAIATYLLISAAFRGGPPGSS